MCVIGRNGSVISRYNSDVLAAYSPDKQTEYVSKYHDRCFAGKAPTLRNYAATHGRDNVRLWLSVQIKDLCEFTGVKKMSPDIMNQTAGTIIAQWPSLKLTELMVFFHLFKAGQYERFFGVADPIVLTSSLKSFVEGYRERELARIAMDEDRKAREEHAGTVVCMEDAIAQGLVPNIAEMVRRSNEANK